MTNELPLSDDKKTTLDKELASLKPRLEIGRAASDAPSFERRQTVISGVIKHVRGLRMFASSKNEPERFAKEDICFAAGIFPEGFSDRHSEADDMAFVWRWFEQARTIEVIANAALDREILGTPMVLKVLRGRLYVPAYRQRLIGRILPKLFADVFHRKFPMTRGGMGMRFVRYCLEQLGEPGAADETIRTCIRNERRVTRQDK